MRFNAVTRRLGKTSTERTFVSRNLEVDDTFSVTGEGKRERKNTAESRVD